MFVCLGVRGLHTSIIRPEYWVLRSTLAQSPQCTRFHTEQHSCAKQVYGKPVWQKAETSEQNNMEGAPARRRCVSIQEQGTATGPPETPAGWKLNLVQLAVRFPASLYTEGLLMHAGKQNTNDPPPLGSFGWSMRSSDGITFQFVFAWRLLSGVSPCQSAWTEVWCWKRCISSDSKGKWSTHFYVFSDRKSLRDYSNKEGL